MSRVSRPLLPLLFIDLTLAASVCACGPGGTAASSGDETGLVDSEETGDETGESCELPTNATPDQAALIRVRNDRPAPIYLAPYSSFACNYAQVELEVGGAPVLWDHPGVYPYACSTSLCGYGCSDGGAMGLIINPGATAEIAWNGGIWADQPLSDACQAESGCPDLVGSTCQARELVSGEYLVRLHLSDECPIEDECMACSEGVCEVFFYEPGPGTEQIEASGSFPETLEIVVD